MIPQLGIGTFKLTDISILRPIIRTAVLNGYTLIDSATSYKNEEQIGQVLQELIEEGVIARSDVFVTSKLKPADQGYDNCKRAVLESLSQLRLDYVDLYLIHWPGTQKVPLTDPRNAVNRHGSYRALIELQQQGLIRHIGVSNFTVPHLEQLRQEFPDHPPAVNQCEVHPLYQERELVQYCRDHGIFVQAYASFGEGYLMQEGLVPALDALVNEHRTRAQILLRWAWNKGYGILPMTTKPERLLENLKFKTIELTQQEMETLDGGELELKVCWDPLTVT